MRQDQRSGCGLVGGSRASDDHGSGDDSTRAREVGRRLYAVPPDRFIEERDRLAREAKDAGDQELARAIGRLRKPTLPAWAVDQLVLHDRDDIDRAFRAGDAARAAMEGQGEGSLRETVTMLREVVAELRQRAGDYLEAIGSSAEQHLDPVERTLTSAAVDPAQRRKVETGMLTRPLESSGFAGLGGLRIANGARTDEAGGTAGRGRRRRLEEEQRRLQQEVEASEALYEEAQRRAASLRERAEAAAAHAGERQHELSEFREQLAEVTAELEAP